MHHHCMTLCRYCAEVGPEQWRDGVYHDETASRAESRVNGIEANQEKNTKLVGICFRVQDAEYGINVKTRTDLKPIENRCIMLITRK
jgi:hypothetical protein